MTAPHNDPSIRKIVADHLYLDRGPQEASSRCDANTKFAEIDLCDEMLRHLQLKPGQKIADVGCGTGQHLLRFAAAVGPTGEARGFDFSEKAVAETRKRGGRADVADGANLPVPDQTFDAVASSFSIYYTADATKTLREWFRVVRPGGRVVISGPAADTNAELYDFHRAVVGVGPADTDLMALGYVEALPPKMKEVGFTDPRAETFTNPIRFPGANEFIDYWSKTSLFARTVSDTQRAAVIARGKQRLAGQTGPLVITKRVAVAIATRP